MMNLKRPSKNRIQFWLRQAAKAGLLLFVGPFVSCNTNSNASLTVSANIQNLILINTAAISCASAAAAAASASVPTSDVSAISFEIPQITVGWNNSNSLNLVWMTVVLKSNGLSGGTFSYQVAGSELMYDWKGSNYDPTGTSSTKATGSYPVISTGNTLPASGKRSASVTYNSNECTIWIGGVGVTNKSSTITGTGTIYIYGTYTSGSVINAATASTVVSFNYEGAGPG